MQFTLQNPNFRETIHNQVQRQYFMQYIGFKLTDIEPGKIEGVGEVSQIMQQQNGFLHGGIIATLADIVAGFSVVTLVKADQHVVTAELKVSYLNPGIGANVFAKGWVLKQGSKLYFCESEVWSRGAEEVLVAKCTATMAVVQF